MEKKTYKQDLKVCHDQVDDVFAPAIYRDLVTLTAILGNKDDQRWGVLYDSNPAPSDDVIQLLLRLADDQGPIPRTTKWFLKQIGDHVKQYLSGDVIKLVSTMEELTSYLTTQYRQTLYQVFVAVAPMSSALPKTKKLRLYSLLTDLFVTAQEPDIQPLVSYICHQLVDIAFTLYRLEMAVYKSWKF